MGCAHSRIDREEAVQRCRYRRRLMKHLIKCRADLHSALVAYLQSLRNTGATLRQFADVESITPCIAPSSSSPLRQLPLPPSPPPPPHYIKNTKNKNLEEEVYESSIDSDDDESCIPRPPPVPDTTWGFVDTFGLPNSSDPASQIPPKDLEASTECSLEEVDWEDTNTEFGEGEEQEEKTETENTKSDAGVASLASNRVRGLRDDNSSIVSGFTKGTDIAMAMWRNKKTLAGIVKELDDYFLRAAAGGNDVVALLESGHDKTLLSDLDKDKVNESCFTWKNSKSAKVFNAFSWSWSSRSPKSKRNCDSQESYIACSPKTQGSILEKIYVEEQKLYRDVKEEEISRFQHKKKTMLLERLETTEPDQIRIEKIRLNIEYLGSRKVSLQESINETCLTISKLRDEELQPQLVKLSLGLVQMWKTMYECHQGQNHKALQANIIANYLGSEPTEARCWETVQLHNEVNSWYTSFCNLTSSLREYVYILNQWVGLTDCLPDSSEVACSSRIHSFCHKWQLALDRLPDKVAADAIKSFSSVILSIMDQQSEERRLQKKSNRLTSKLEKELNSFHELENMVEARDQATAATNQQPLSAKHAKLAALKKRADEEKARYLESIQIRRATTLSNLHKDLPNVFQVLASFAGACMQEFRGIDQPVETTRDNPVSLSSL